jgi:hypothetical protein
MMAEGRRRPTSSILAAIAQRRACASWGYSPSRRPSSAVCEPFMGRWPRVCFSLVVVAWGGRGGPGRVWRSPEVPGVVTCAQGVRGSGIPPYLGNVRWGELLLRWDGKDFCRSVLCAKDHKPRIRRSLRGSRKKRNKTTRDLDHLDGSSSGLASKML